MSETCNVLEILLLEIPKRYGKVYCELIYVLKPVPPSFAYWSVVELHTVLEKLGVCRFGVGVSRLPP